MEKNLCNYINENGRCKNKAIRVNVITITTNKKIRVKLCKKHTEEIMKDIKNLKDKP